MFEKVALHERVQVAKKKTLRLVDHLMYLLELHENNAIVLYSPTLSCQIPPSFAANAFNVFQQGLHQFEIVRLCALWDRAEWEKENIPTVIELIDYPDVIENLAEENASHWKSFGGSLLNPSDDPELRALEAEAVQNANEQFGQEQAAKARTALRKAIIDSRAILESQKFASIMNLRDKHLAHSLSETRRERKVGPLPFVKYGDERDLLEATLPIVEALHCWVNGASLSLQDSREIDRKNAKALWEACTFNIIE
jgi:AbiU2